jgi:fatty acid desaturase
MGLELLGFLLIYYSGYSNWFTYILAAMLIATAQAQAGWYSNFINESDYFRYYIIYLFDNIFDYFRLQHDLGHLSVFKSNNMNRLAHQFVMGTIKGVR